MSDCLQSLPRANNHLLLDRPSSLDWRSDELIVAHTGEPAVRTGRWAARDDLGGRVYWLKGDPLPLNKGQPVDWVYSGP